ncbi:MAG: hypothetical protein ABF272_05270, partial [Flavobacteriales bacterium]
EFDSKDTESLDYTNKEFGWEHLFLADSNFITLRGIYLKVDLELFDSNISNQNGALFVVDLQDSNGQNYHYYTFPIRDVPPNKLGWKKEQYQIELPKIRRSGDRLKLYIWNKENESFLLDNLKVNVIGIN